MEGVHSDGPNKRGTSYRHWIYEASILLSDYRRKPTTGGQSPSLCDKWHRIFYMPSRIDEAGHTKDFDYPVAEHWAESQIV